MDIYLVNLLARRQGKRWWSSRKNRKRLCRSSVGSEGSEEDFVVGDTVSFEKGVFNNSNDGFNEGAFNGYTISDLEVVAVSFNNQIFVGEDGFTFDRDKDEFIGLDKERARLD